MRGGCLQTNCVDNGPPEGLQTFLTAASDDPQTVLHYEFMQASCAQCLQVLVLLLLPPLLLLCWQP
jgi:hypothetical protein